jgi:predicted permease
MTRLRIFFHRLLGLILKRRLERELEEEIRSHLEMQIEDNLRQGMSPEDARRAARLKFGGVEQVKEAYWDKSRLGWMENLWQDLRYGARMLLKNPGLTLAVALSLALGIGANTVVFSLLDAVLLKTLPVKEPERLVLFRWLSGEKKVWTSTSSEWKRERDEATGLETGTSFSYPAFEHFRANNQSLSETFAFVYAMANLNIDGQAETASGQLISGNYFAGLGLPVLVGRTFTNDDDKASADPAAVISYKYWRRRFGGDPAVVGKTIYIGNTPVTIVGVAPPEFYGTSNIGKAADFWVPLALTPKVMLQRFYQMDNPKSCWLNIMGRLKPGVNARQAQAELDLEMRQHAAELQKSFKDQRDIPRLDLDPGGQGLMQARRQFSEPLRMLMIIVGLVLAVACLNVANLLLSRAATRRKEIAVRLAAGASRLRLIRQLLTESLLLAVLGGALGLAFAYWGRDVLVALRPLAATLPDLKLDLRVLGFTTAVTILTGILFGLAPALRATKVDLTFTLKDGAGQTGYSRSRLSKGLVIAQVAMSLVLLIGAGLFVRTLRNLARIDLGFNRKNLLLFSVNPGAIGYKNERLANLYQQLLERIETTPGVRSATASDFTPLSGSSTSSFCMPGYTPKPGENLSYLSVAANYFETMEMPILQGRGLSSHDIEPLISAMATIQNSVGKPPKDFVEPRRVAVINQAMARKYFSNVDPIGRRFSFSLPCKDGEGIEIVGVVRDAKYGGLKWEILPVAYVAYVNPSFGAPPGMTFTVRTAGDPVEMTAAIRKATQEVEPRLPLYGIQTQDAQIAQLVTQERLFASLSSFFGLLALVLVAIGLYGVMSYTVARRTHEIGVRMALGAQAADVLRLVMRETLCLALAGVALGVPAALVATRWIESQLFGLTPHDPMTITMVMLSLMAVMALAGYLPARKAARVDPLVALRCE